MIVFRAMVQERAAVLSGAGPLSDCHGEQADSGIIVDRHQGPSDHAAALDSPFVVLLKQDGADEPGEGGAAGSAAWHGGGRTTSGLASARSRGCDRVVPPPAFLKFPGRSGL